MGLIDLIFRSRRSRINAQIAPMLAMVAADGTVGAEELAFVAMRMQELGISRTEFEALLRNPPPLTLPSSRADRIRILVETSLVMLADGKIDPAEMRLFAGITARMGLSGADAAMALTVARRIVGSIRPGLDLDQEIAQSLSSFANED